VEVAAEDARFVSDATAGQATLRAETRLSDAQVEHVRRTSCNVVLRTEDKVMLDTDDIEISIVHLIMQGKLRSIVKRLS